jgi:hypothetical protein
MCALAEMIGREKIIAADIRKPSDNATENCRFEELDVLDAEAIADICAKNKIDYVWTIQCA